MQSVVVYASRKGNTQRVAEAIADALRPAGDVRIAPVEQVALADVEQADLLVIGGPTEGHGPTPALRAFVEELAPARIRGHNVAVFDTRLKWPRLLSGSAAATAAHELAGAGAHLVAKPESFIVSTEPELLPGELERASAWGSSLIELARTDGRAVEA